MLRMSLIGTNVDVNPNPGDMINGSINELTVRVVNRK